MPWWVTENLPFIIFMFFVSIVKSQAVYGMGRAVPAAVSRWGTNNETLAKWDKWLQGPQVKRGAQILERWGIIVIPLSFLTVGIQTLVLAAAGVTRMRWWIFTVASLPGCVAWGVIYGAGLSVGWHTVSAALEGNRWAITVVVAALLVIIMLVARKKPEEKRADEGGKAETPKGSAT